MYDLKDFKAADHIPALLDWMRAQMKSCGGKTAVVGISGGLDSTLALLVAVRTFDKLGLPRRSILGVTMPGFGTTDRTRTNALQLMESLGVGIREISIREACAVHFRDIGMDDADRSVAYENAQARERTQILMDLANRTGGLVIGTGDLSELALGWATYNGDHMSMYGVNCGVPKTLVRHLVRWVAAHPDYEAARGWLLDIVDTPISPELLPADEKGEIVRDSQGRPMQGEVLDFGTKKVYDDGYEPRTIVEPTFLENLNYFFNYQLSYMYWRYFLWNFVGRQSDIQPTRVTITDGNWLSGIKWIDEKYLGPQDGLPREIADNKGRNTYYFLPFLLGLIGLIYQLNRDQRNFSIVMWLFIMTGIALVFYFNTSPGEPRERDYVYAGSFYAFCIWIGFGVLAIRDLVAWLTRRNNVTAAVAATVVCMGVPTILAAQNWDDHDRSHRYMARDIGWNYLMSTLPNSIILNYGDNDTFPLWNNQEIYGVRPDVRIMNTSYLGGEWYIDEMKTKANDAPGVPFSLPKSKYTFTNDWVPVDNRFDRAVDIKDVIEFVRSEDPRSKIKLSDGTMTDYIPTKRIALPVNKENAIASGIVAEKDRAQMVDTVYINLRKNSIDKTQLMILDMLANFDWKRPLYMTQVYILQDFGLMDYLQFDGYAYRFVPLLTPVQNPWEIGRIDADYAAPLLKETFRYGNLADPRVYADYFIQYNLSASHARDAFARVAKELLRQDRAQEAVELLDMGLEKLPPSQIRFTDSNTYPFLEAYYAASAMGVEDAADKGDALLREYARTLIEYIEYYLRFDGVQGDMVSPIIDEKLDQLGDVYYLAVYAGRKEIIGEINAYYRSLGVEEENLVDVGDKPHQVDTTLIPRKDTAQ